jgi:hypothetical protein
MHAYPGLSSAKRCPISAVALQILAIPINSRATGALRAVVSSTIKLFHAIINKLSKDRTRGTEGCGVGQRGQRRLETAKNIKKRRQREERLKRGILKQNG